jgi:hypothetical protein
VSDEEILALLQREGGALVEAFASATAKTMASVYSQLTQTEAPAGRHAAGGTQ